jgi:stearoyl-CoA desaturase (delta-9 desaturase)
MNSKYSFKNLDIVNTLFITLTPLFAVGLTYWWAITDGFNWGQVFLAIAFYFMTGLAITAGYHRLYSHKAYDSHPLVKFFYLIFGAATFQNSILKWGSDHRVHHQKVDTESDPYNINEGFFHAHVGWIFLKRNSEINDRYVKDFLNDRMVMWQHRNYILISVVIGFILPALLGELLFNSWLGGVALGGFARIVVTHHCTFFINSLCHTVGSTPYTNSNSAKDSWYMALFTFGEGYHNFHHYFQTDYRNGIRWYHFDPTKWLIKSLNWVGLTYKLKQTPEEKIIAAKMHMRSIVVKSKLEDSADKFMAELEILKAQAIESYQKWQELKAEYKRAKKEQAALRLNELNAKINEKKAEFDAVIEQWEFMIQNYGQAHGMIKA